MSGLITPRMRYMAGRIRAKDCPFGSPDGVTSGFPLADRHGHSVTKDVRIQSIHQTDWQGRVELRDQPRTNLVTSSVNASGWSPVGATTTDAGEINVGGQAFQAALVSDPDANWNGISVPIDLSGERDGNFAIGVSYTITAYVRSGVGNSFYVALIQQPDGSYPQAGTRWQGNLDSPQAPGVTQGFCTVGAWAVEKLSDGLTYRLTYTFTTLDVPNAAGAYWNIGPRGSADPNASITVLGAMLERADRPGAFIPTTGSPVTVTDYTHNGVGGIATGQVPADGAELDWTGTARRA